MIGKVSETRSLVVHRPGASGVQIIQVNAAVWDEALIRAGDDRRRLEILSKDAVYVHNSPYWRR